MREGWIYYVRSGMGGKGRFIMLEAACAGRVDLLC